ncbi:hypothetical protein [Streptomyces sp. ODS28]|uniref:hypothetical protein n=1 Tax=Streptomyces sp. ODS28 TaxID=3136688 RepID=UPI0031EF5D37
MKIARTARAAGLLGRLLAERLSGESAYSALSLEKGDGDNMHREKQLTVGLADRNLHGTGATAKLRAPGPEGLASSDNSTVSYWNNTIEDVLT